MFVRSRLMAEAAGTSLYGPDLSKWPSLIVDAFCLLQAEDQLVERKRRASVAQKSQEQ